MIVLSPSALFPEYQWTGLDRIYSLLLLAAFHCPITSLIIRW